MRGAQKEPTCTSLVLEALRAKDNFMGYADLTKATGCTPNQVSAACFCLRKYRAVDVVVEADGRPWWFALPPESDQRYRPPAERTPESKPRKLRRSGRYAKKAAP